MLALVTFLLVSHSSSAGLKVGNWIS